MIFEITVGPALSLVCYYDDTIHRKTADIVWEQIKEHKITFSGSFSAEKLESSVLISLLKLVFKIEHCR